MVTEEDTRTLKIKELDITMLVDDGQFKSTDNRHVVRDPGFLHRQTQLRLYLGHSIPNSGHRTPPITLDVPLQEYFLELSAPNGLPVWLHYTHLTDEVGSPLASAEQVSPSPIRCPTAPGRNEAPYNIFPTLWHFDTPDDLQLSATIWRPVADGAIQRTGLPPLAVVGRCTLDSSDFLLPSHKRVIARQLVSPELTTIGKIYLTFLVVWPFQHPGNTLANASHKQHGLLAKPYIGHRGLGSNKYHGGHRVLVSENTQLSFQLAAASGVQYIEFDALLTKDDGVVIHHDFEFEAGAWSDGTPLVVPVRLVTVDEFVNRTKPSRAVRSSLQRTGSHSNTLMDIHSLDAPAGHAPFDMRQSSDTVKALVSDRPPVFRPPEPGQYHVIFEQRTTLQTMFAQLPMNLGFNIEVKYPTRHAMSGLVHYPSRPHTVETILRVVLDCLQTQPDRPVYFSSFDPEVVTLLRLKQVRIPVFFLNVGSLSEERIAEMAPSADVDFDDNRCRNPYHAVMFAAQLHLTGMVFSIQTLIGHPDLVQYAHDLNLLVYTYGSRSDDAELQNYQWKDLRVDGIIADNVLSQKNAKSPASEHRML